MVAGFRVKIQAQDFEKHKAEVMTAARKGWTSFCYGVGEDCPSTLVKCRMGENFSLNVKTANTSFENTKR
jgi:hypothetical protein